ncbi:asparagine synthase (glutamine-hydrolyzing) [Edaphobacter dinghuensis]|uniref:asparagine synthase (glutamine-hydrolyzing) n=1 Tax=Edaphobacter dinghuensis TaxID=1560005 RepID=A0A917H5K2_9BACT|nr:asparagine synthase (glutamine-hydrolyzing) [Edaphobacter dinghuensis]GGG68706.1 asparagine synthetase B [Edaphobacter dinghuensis]
MCGIAGWVNFGEYFPNEKVQRSILDSMKERGPDDERRWVHPEKKALLLHRRLTIRDLSANGAQPMTTSDGKLTIIFNGEIYNSDELRSWALGYPFKGTSDTECILALYQKFGPQVLTYLRGMYAFAIWDEEKSSLFVARDPYGIKPLYIAQTRNGFWFASQVKSLLEVPEVDLSPEPAGHAGFFLWGSVPEPYTLYKGIRSLRAGHCLWLKDGTEPQFHQFASVSKSLAEALPSAEDDVPIFARLRNALHDSVKVHFASDVPVAVFLSAGLDSSTILGIASDVMPSEALKALTLGFDMYQNTPGDETAEAALIAEHYGVAHQTTIISKEDFSSEATRLIQVMDQPTIDGINSYFVAKMAREAGFKVAFSGVGGDELFGGYGSFRQIPQAVTLVRRFNLSRRFGRLFRRYTERLLGQITSPKYAGILEYGNTVEDAYLLRRGLFMPWELPQVLDSDLALAGLEALDNDAFVAKELSDIKTLPLYAQVSALESTRYLRNQLLRDADWAGMAHSVEIRTPLVDYSLLKQLASLIRSNHPPSKLAMAITPKRALPPQIMNRKKSGFAVPVRDWLASSLPEKPERGLRSWAKFIYKSKWIG